MAKTSKNQKTTATANNSQKTTAIVENSVKIEDSITKIESIIDSALNSVRTGTMTAAFYVNDVAIRKLCEGEPRIWALSRFKIEKAQFYNYCRVADKFLYKNEKTGEIENTISPLATFSQLSYLSHKELTEKDIKKATELINLGIPQKMFEKSMNSQLGIEDKSKKSEKSDKKGDSDKKTEDSDNLTVEGKVVYESEKTLETFRKLAIDFVAFLNSDHENESFQKMLENRDSLNAIRIACGIISDKLLELHI